MGRLLVYNPNVRCGHYQMFVGCKMCQMGYSQTSECRHTTIGYHLSYHSIQLKGAPFEHMLAPHSNTTAKTLHATPQHARRIPGIQMQNMHPTIEIVFVHHPYPCQTTDNMVKSNAMWMGNDTIAKNVVPAHEACEINACMVFSNLSHNNVVEGCPKSEYNRYAQCPWTSHVLLCITLPT